MDERETGDGEFSWKSARFNVGEHVLGTKVLCFHSSDEYMNSWCGIWYGRSEIQESKIRALESAVSDGTAVRLVFVMLLFTRSSCCKLRTSPGVGM